MLLFLLLSLLSGVLELGGLFLSSANGAQGWALFVLPLMYQLGNLLPAAPPVTPRRAGAAGAGFLLTGLLFPGPAMFMIQVMAASMCIQMARAAQKDNCPTWLKRCFRIGGFVLSPVMALWPAATMAICLLLPTVALLARPVVSGGTAPGAAGVPVMIFHQMHYFVYTYIMPAWFYALSGSFMLSGLMFGLTWVIYLLPQTIVERAGPIEPRKMFFACHVFLALDMGVLCAASVFGNVSFMCAAWLLSGLGGGSVFCIKELPYAGQSAALTFSENIGHAAGVLAAVLISAALPEAVIPALTGASCVLVCLTLASAAILMAKEEKRHANAG